jgi:hypothetical protein
MDVHNVEPDPPTGDLKGDLIALCAAMRAAQRRYFTQGRSSVDRDEAIRLERQWDRDFARFRKTGGQMEMFPAAPDVVE